MLDWLTRQLYQKFADLCKARDCQLNRVELIELNISFLRWATK